MRTLKNLMFAIKKAFSILPSRREKNMVLFLWLFAIASYFISMLFPSIQMWITDGAASLLGENIRYRYFVLGFAGLAISVLIDFIARKKFFAWSDYVSSLVADYIYGDILKKGARLKYKYFEEKEVYDRLKQTSSTVPGRIASMITWDTLPPIFGGIVSMFFVTLTLCRVHWSIAFLAAIGNVTSIYFYYKRMKDNYYLQVKQIPQRRWADTYWRILTEKKSQKEIVTFGLTDYLIQKWKYYSVITAKQNFKFSLKYAVIMLTTDLVSVFFKILALCVAALMILGGKASVGTFMLVYGSINVFNGYLSDISRAFINISENSLYINKWQEYMELEEENLGENTIQKEDDLDIEFANVRYQYRNAEKAAIEGLFLKIRQGEKIAIVGENGSGKSTFTALLNGLYDDYEGNIRINGQEIRKNLSLVRDNIVTAFQDYGCYELSIKDNISMGNMKAQCTDEEIREAAEKAGALGFIDDLERGINTEIGSYSDKGIHLSGGQWQKLALARTFLNMDAKLVILDEPTASLDPFTESIIYKRFLEQNKNQTAIMISHRLGAVTFADRILVFAGGKIVEEGSHAKLMGKRGLYFDMYTAQARMYKEEKI